MNVAYSAEIAEICSNIVKYAVFNFKRYAALWSTDKSNIPIRRSYISFSTTVGCEKECTSSYRPEQMISLALHAIRHQR